MKIYWLWKGPSGWKLRLWLFSGLQWRLIGKTERDNSCRTKRSRKLWVRLREEPTQASKTSLHFSTRSRLPCFFSTRPKLPCFFFFFHPIQTSLLIQPNQSLLKSPSFFNTTQTSVLLSIRPRSLSFLPLDPNLPRFSFFFFFALPQMSPGKGSGFSGIKNIYTFTLVQMAATARNKKSVLYQEIIRWTLNHTYSRRHSGFLY